MVRPGTDGPETRAESVPFREALRYWIRLGFVNFGGPAGQIAMMHRDLVERRRWISEGRFLHALNYCMLLPGPEAQQLAIYIGWLLHRTAGGIAAGVFFVLPAAFLLWGLAWLYAAHGEVAWVAAVFYGVKPAVLAVVVEAVVRIGKRALRNAAGVAVAAGAFAALRFWGVPFPAVIVGAGILGFLADRFSPGLFMLPPPKVGDGKAGALHGDDSAAPAHAAPSRGRAARVLAVCTALWAAPLAALWLWRGRGDVLVELGIFFSKAAMVTFGGAYAVLAYVGQQAVGHYGWITAPQMVDGLGLAESTPGPLIMVTQFVGFLAAWRHPGDLAPVAAGTLGALITTWVTFVPCFLWIFLGAPYIERLRGNRMLTAVLSAITAAVVGVIGNLSVFFAGHTVWGGSGALDPFAVGAALAAFAALAWRRWNMLAVIAGCAAAGAVWKLSVGS